MTKKNELSILRNNEKRNSKIKDTRSFILKNRSYSLLNNCKWYEVFEWIDNNNVEFELKTLLSSDNKKSKNILELNNSSLLIESSEDFIEFLELEKIILENTLGLKIKLEELNIEFTENPNCITINGYRR